MEPDRHQSSRLPSGTARLPGTDAAAFEDRLRQLSRVLGGVVAVQGAVALLGWSVGNETLQGEYSSGINIKTNAAVALLLTGTALVLLAPTRRIGLQTWTGRVFAFLAGAIGLATLSQHVFGWNLGIDEALFRERPGVPGTMSPNRMGPPASTSFPLLALSLLLFDARTRGRTLMHLIAGATLVISFFPLVGYIFAVQEFYGVARISGIALPTAICFMMLSVGILLARPQGGPARLLVAQDAGGMVVRRLLPAALVIPIVLGWLRVYFQDFGFYDVHFGRTLLTLSFIVVFSGLIWWNARAISQQSAARQRAEAAERELTARLFEALERERTARESAEHANRMKDEFLATLSHELRTPLNAILGWAGLLARGKLDEAAHRRGLEAIERNSKLQARLIDDLLDMSRIVSGKIRLDIREVDLEQVADSVLVAITPVADAKGVKVERDIDRAVGRIHGDPERLQQVLWNLLSNAVKFTPWGGRARVELRRHNAEVELTVSDTGMGIPPELRSGIFDQFRQADASTTRRHGGLGLGLSIAKRLVELHGGSIRVESEGEGKGSTFIVRLPGERRGLRAAGDAGSALPPKELPHGVPGALVAEATELAAASAEAAPRCAAGDEIPTDDGDAPDGAPRLAGIRVLVVDDHTDGRELAERILRDHGADVVAAESASKALEVIGARSLDVLVCDIAMPGQDGYDLIREVRRRAPRLPAVALTAFADEGSERQVRDAGYQLHLPRPIEPERLVVAVARLARSASSGNYDADPIRHA